MFGISLIRSWISRLRTTRTIVQEDPDKETRYPPYDSGVAAQVANVYKQGESSKDTPRVVTVQPFPYALGAEPIMVGYIHQPEIASNSGDIVPVVSSYPKGPELANLRNFFSEQLENERIANEKLNEVLTQLIADEVPLGVARNILVGVFEKAGVNLSDALEQKFLYTGDKRARTEILNLLFSVENECPPCVLKILEKREQGDMLNACVQYLSQLDDASLETFVCYSATHSGEENHLALAKSLQAVADMRKDEELLLRLLRIGPMELTDGVPGMETPEGKKIQNLNLQVFKNLSKEKRKFSLDHINYFYGESIHEIRRNIALVLTDCIRNEIFTKDEIKDFYLKKIDEYRDSSDLGRMIRWDAVAGYGCVFSKEATSKLLELSEDSDPFIASLACISFAEDICGEEGKEALVNKVVSDIKTKGTSNALVPMIRAAKAHPQLNLILMRICSCDIDIEKALLKAQGTPQCEIDEEKSFLKLEIVYPTITETMSYLNLFLPAGWIRDSDNLNLQLNAGRLICMVSKEERNRFLAARKEYQVVANILARLGLTDFNKELPD